MNKSPWAFLKSPRFYAIAIAAVALYLRTDGFIDAALFNAIAAITAGFTLVGTADKVAKHLGNIGTTTMVRTDDTAVYTDTADRSWQYTKSVNKSVAKKAK